MPVLVGTSGWQYDDWRGRFYPQDLPQRLSLEHHAVCGPEVVYGGHVNRANLYRAIRDLGGVREGAWRNTLRIRDHGETTACRRRETDRHTRRPANRVLHQQFVPRLREVVRRKLRFRPHSDGGTRLADYHTELRHGRQIGVSQL